MRRAAVEPAARPLRSEYVTGNYFSTLGADRAKVVRLVLRGALNRVLIGLALGLPLAIGAGRLISSELYGVSSWDPLALAVAASGLAICAFFAAMIPATRAASISPTNALRAE